MYTIHNNIWDTFKLFHFIINFILTRKQQQLVHNQFFASTFQPYSWVLPRSLWRLELCGRLASTLIEIIGMFWRELLPLPSILSGKRSGMRDAIENMKVISRSYETVLRETWGYCTFINLPFCWFWRSSIEYSWNGCGTYVPLWILDHTFWNVCFLAKMMDTTANGNNTKVINTNAALLKHEKTFIKSCMSVPNDAMK